MRNATKGGIPFKQPLNAKRNSTERNADLPIVASLHMRGRTMVQIAKYLTEIRPYSVSPQMVSGDLETMKNVWLESAMIDYNAAKGNEIAKIDNLEAAAWDAWERSWEDMETEEVETHEKQFSVGDIVPADEMNPGVLEGQNNHKLIEAKKRHKKQGRLGLKAYLDVIQWCIERRIKIYGLDSPKQIEVRWRQQLESYGLNPDDVIDGVAQDIYDKATAPKLVTENGANGHNPST